VPGDEVLGHVALPALERHAVLMAGGRGAAAEGEANPLVCSGGEEVRVDLLAVIH
jgi:hypothetical protein